jgi:hypothetical protein
MDLNQLSRKLRLLDLLRCPKVAIRLEHGQLLTAALPYAPFITYWVRSRRHLDLFALRSHTPTVVSFKKEKTLLKSKVFLARRTEKDIIHYCRFDENL